MLTKQNELYSQKLLILYPTNVVKDRIHDAHYSSYISVA